MKVTLYIFSVLLLASAVSLIGCVNHVTNPPNIQSPDTLSRLEIIYSIPDSNDILAVTFRTSMSPSWQKNYRIDWNFGDSTGSYSKFDTSNLTHYYKKFGSYIVTLSIFDTVAKIVLGKTSVLLDLIDNAIDVNFFHGFKNINISFTCARLFENKLDTSVLSMDIYNPNDSNIFSKWVGNYFNMSSSHSSHTIDMYHDEYTQSTDFSIKGKISYSGNQLDSITVEWDYGETHNRRSDLGGSDRKEILIFKFIPLVKRTKDAIVYSFIGSGTQAFISQFTDITNGHENLNTYSKGGPVTVLWDQMPTPSLTVTFF